VPHLWRSEVANGFLIAHKRGILSQVQNAQAFSELDILLAHSIENVDYGLSIQRLVGTAKDFGLTAYDATYLETARELQLALATLDRSLAAAAARAGVSLVA
jgi:predicted nucleic acid-binding protein